MSMDTLIKVEVGAPATSHDVIHNRWHPDIPMVAYVKPDSEFRVECIDWTGGQIKDDDDATDVKIVDLTKVHYLSGPIRVGGREPRCLLVLRYSRRRRFKRLAVGFHGNFRKGNGG